MTKTRINLNSDVTAGNIRTLNGDVCDIADNVQGFMFKFRLSPKGNADSRRPSDYKDLEITDDVLNHWFKSESFSKKISSKSIKNAVGKQLSLFEE